MTTTVIFVDPVMQILCIMRKCVLYLFASQCLNLVIASYKLEKPTLGKDESV